MSIASVRRRFIRIFLPLLAVISLQVVKNVGLSGIIAIQGISKLQDVEVVSEVTQEIVIIHTKVGVKISLQQVRTTCFSSWLPLIKYYVNRTLITELPLPELEAVLLDWHWLVSVAATSESCSPSVVASVAVATVVAVEAASWVADQLARVV